jgi:hypothetical protein
MRYVTQEIYLEIYHDDSSPARFILRDHGEASFPEKRLWEEKGLQAEMRRQNGLYQHEWRLDIDKISQGKVVLRPNMVLGFDMILSDQAADGFVSVRSWGKEAEQRRHAVLLGDIVLVGGNREIGFVQGEMVWKETDEGITRGKVRVRSLLEPALWVQVATDQRGGFSVRLPTGVYQVEAGLGRGENKGVTVETETEKTVAVRLVVEQPKGETIKAGSGRVIIEEKLYVLLEGHVGYLIGGLRQRLSKNQDRLTPSQKKALTKTITYFDNHRHMMHYDVYLNKGYPIATGVIEGTCGSLVKDRMEQSGMRWSIAGAQAVLAQRAVVKNGDWNDFFTYYIDAERQRLYPTVYHTDTSYLKAA